MKDVVKEYWNLRKLLALQRVQSRSCYSNVIAVENQLLLAKADFLKFAPGLSIFLICCYSIVRNFVAGTNTPQ
jgi:hypothetical protein